VKKSKPKNDKPNLALAYGYYPPLIKYAFGYVSDEMVEAAINSDSPDDKKWLVEVAINAINFKAPDDCGGQELLKLLACDAKALKWLKGNLHQWCASDMCASDITFDKVIGSGGESGRPTSSFLEAVKELDFIATIKTENGVSAAKGYEYLVEAQEYCKYQISFAKEDEKKSVAKIESEAFIPETEDLKQIYFSQAEFLTAQAARDKRNAEAIDKRNAEAIEKCNKNKDKRHLEIMAKVDQTLTEESRSSRAEAIKKRHKKYKAEKKVPIPNWMDGSKTEPKK
jgi:hypothetical protein